MKAKHCQLVIVFFFCIFLTSCTAAGINPLENSEIVGQNMTAGFWIGLWHGVIAPITFLISLFVSSVNIYEVHNNGGWYDFGFVLGTGIFSQVLSILIAPIYEFLKSDS
jgi:hypothetical protein